MSPKQIDRVLIWDSEDPPPEGDGAVILWRRTLNSCRSNCVSIPSFVEEHAESLKSRYLAWVYELGELRVNGLRLIDHLEVRPGFSYWWMSSIAQKANISADFQVNEAVKVLALDKMAAEHAFSSITLVSSNRRLSECISALCKQRDIRCEWSNIGNIHNKPSVKAACRMLPPFSRAFVYFFWYLLRMAPILLQRKQMSSHLATDIMFVDVLVHLRNCSLATGNFCSNYWGPLVEKLSAWNITSTWLHHYFRYFGALAPKGAVELTQRFSSSSRGVQTHSLTEQHLSFASLYKAVRDYLYIRKKFHFLRSEIQASSFEAFLWPLHVDEWSESLCGKEAFKNCVTLSMVENAVASFPNQKIGVYIQENQPWEMALIYAWKFLRNGPLIGTPHSVVRFWDLRYYFDKRSFSNTGVCELPAPDIVAVNGPVAKKNMLSSGWPADRIREVEALRYSHLSRPVSENRQIGSDSEAKTVLICGDFRREATFKMLSLVENAEALAPTKNTYIFKPHPALDINISGSSIIKMLTSNDSIADALAKCDLVFASNTTSAAVDAYCLGIRVIQILHDDGLNFSPLRGLPDVTYINSPIELTSELNRPTTNQRKLNQNYFYLDDALYRWKELFDVGE